MILSNMIVMQEKLSQAESDINLAKITFRAPLEDFDSPQWDDSLEALLADGFHSLDEPHSAHCVEVIPDCDGVPNAPDNGHTVADCDYHVAAGTQLVVHSRADTLDGSRSVGASAQKLFLSFTWIVGFQTRSVFSGKVHRWLQMHD